MKNKKAIFILLISTALIVSAAGTVTAIQEESDIDQGDGSSENPYVIKDWYDLNETRNEPNANYKLGNDLNSDTNGYKKVVDTDKGFKPIKSGSDYPSFEGTFDGNGHTIKNLYINRPNTNYVGLFGSLTGTVANVSLKNVNITGNKTVGGLAGTHSRGYATVLNSSVTGKVTGNNKVGGLIGNNNGLVENCYSTANVNGEENNVGGLIGYNGFGYVNNTYSTGDVAGNNTVGGLIGQNRGTVNNTYAIGKVTGNETADKIGGLVGHEYSWRTVDDSYWNTETTNQEKGVGDKDGVVTDDVKGLITSEMTEESAKDNMDFDFDNTWRTTDSYPALYFETLSPVKEDETKTQDLGSSASPITLIFVRNNPVEDERIVNTTVSLEKVENSMYPDKPGLYSYNTTKTNSNGVAVFYASPGPYQANIHQNNQITQEVEFYKPGIIKGVTVYLNGTDKGTLN